MPVTEILLALVIAALAADSKTVIDRASRLVREARRRWGNISANETDGVGT